MKLIFQGLVCKSSQPILGDAGASYYLTGHQGHLKPQAHKNRAQPPPLALRWGSWEFSNLLCSQSDTAEGVTGRPTAKSVYPDFFSALGSPGHGWAS